MITAFLFLLLASGSSANSVTYEIVSYRTGHSEVVASGRTEISEFQTQGKYKTFPLHEDVLIRVGAPPAGRKSGFAMVVVPKQGGFSWEWFDRAKGDRFEKRQEGGAVRVQTSPQGRNLEVTEIEFLSDISLRVIDPAKPGTVLQRVNISKGSRIKLK